jgi:hypothetical protein
MLSSNEMLLTYFHKKERRIKVCELEKAILVNFIVRSFFLLEELDVTK